MESQYQENSQVDKINNNNNNYLCRQSSSRWTPTTEQIKLLKDLYYINGVRSPSADQIHAICSRLRRYGKIEGKNVFYWFQNHKARERQKKRLIPTSNNSNNSWKQDEFTKYPGICCSSSTTAGVVSTGGGQLMENKFRDCSISGVFNGNNTTSPWSPLGSTTTTYAYTTTSTYAYNNNNNNNNNNFHDKISPTFNQEDHEHNNNQYLAAPQQIETLPLFPMHDKDDHHRNHHYPSSAFYNTGGGYRYGVANGGAGADAGASLELSLNSYGYGCYSHNY